MVLIGPAIISDGGDDWAASRAIVRTMKADIARVRTPQGFGFSPEKVRDLIADGVTTIVLCTEDGDVNPHQVSDEFVVRNFSGVVSANPQVRFVLELGNEPNLVAGLDIWNHRYDALRTLKQYKPQFRLPNLRWSVSLPTTMADVINILARDEHGCILDHIDVWTSHLYGWHHLGDGAGNDGKWNDILTYALARTTLPILITEAGIDDDTTPRVEKAKRYLAWAKQANPRIEGLCIWGLGRWEDNPTFEIDMALATEIGKRSISQPQPEPEPEPTPMGTPTLGPSLTTAAQAIAWARTKGSHQRFLDVIPTYYAICPRYNVPAENAVPQAGKETNWGHFTGVVPWTHHNWCGLKVKAGGDNNDPNAHEKFESDADGVLAHVQHLAKYGGQPIPVDGDEMLDPRAHLVTLGIAPTLEQLGGKWAPSPTYGNEIATLRNQIVSFKIQEQPPMDRQLRIALSAGHHNHDGGNETEYALVGPICRAYAEEFRRRGCDVRVVTPNDGLGQFNGGLQQVAQTVVNWATSGWVADLFMECHTEGVDNQNVRGVFAIYPDWGDDVDADVRDHLGPAIARAISNATGIPLRGNGTMSEKSTGVGIDGSRLGVFLRSAPIRGTTTRMIVEHGAHSSPKDLAILRQAGTAEKIAQAGVAAVLEHFGVAIMEPQDQGPERVLFDTGKTMTGGFLAFWRDNGGLKAFGNPITEELIEPGHPGAPAYEPFRVPADHRLVQYCERSKLIYFPEHKGTEFEVQPDHLGRKALEAREAA